MLLVSCASEELQPGSSVFQDPFYEHGLADFRIIERRSSQRANDISKRIAAE
jgi:hypothetical protein